MKSLNNQESKNGEVLDHFWNFGMAEIQTQREGDSP